MDLPTVVGLVKALGVSGLMFAIWYLTLKFFQNVLKSQKEYFNQIVGEQTKRNEENFQVLNKFAESIEYLGGQMSTMNSKIENQHNCPIIRKELEKNS